MKSLWTAWLEYEATGEGQSLLVWIGYSRGGAEARDAFAERFGHFFASMCNCEPGVAENDVTRLLIPEATLECLRRASGKSYLEFHSQLHLNVA